jgi:hypothetical protein
VKGSGGCGVGVLLQTLQDAGLHILWQSGALQGYECLFDCVVVIVVFKLHNSS